jgi:hypothetical protein
MPKRGPIRRAICDEWAASLPAAEFHPSLEVRHRNDASRARETILQGLTQ